MTVVLWHIELSHYNEKVRWALDYKGVAHERRVPMPGFHRLSALAVIDLESRAGVCPRTPSQWQQRYEKNVESVR